MSEKKSVNDEEIASLGPGTDRALPLNLEDMRFNLLNPQTGVIKSSGKLFLKAILQDRSGQAPLRCWTNFEQERDEDVEKFNRIKARIAETNFVRIKKIRAEEYNNALQFVCQISCIDPYHPTNEDMQFLIPSSKKDADKMFETVKSLLHSIDHPGIRELANQYLGDADLMEKFKRVPAAVTLHHAWAGGLLEHTSTLMSLADKMLPFYPSLSRDVVLMGLFLHDLDKTSELKWDGGFEYTERGNLIGHIASGAIRLELMAARVKVHSPGLLPRKTLLALQHILLSHHNLPEHGAAKRPSTPEAIFVAMLDNLDAQTTLSLTLADREREGSTFTDRVWSLETRLWRVHPTN